MSTCTKAFCNNVYLFAPDHKGKVIASRAEKIINDELFCENHLSSSDINFITSNLHTFAHTPLLVILDGLPAIVSTFMYPSSGICLAVNLKVSLRSMLSVIGDGNILVSTSYKDISPASRISQNTRNSILEVLSAILLLNENIGILRDGGMYHAASLSALRARIIFDFMGCELKAPLLFPFGEIKDYDISLFTAFIFCTAIFVRRATSSRCAELSFYKTSEGLTASVSTSLSDKPDKTEFEFLRRQTELMNIYFCTSIQNYTMKIEICPQRPDYSKLGLKNDPIISK